MSDSAGTARFRGGTRFTSYTGLAPRASETGQTDRKGQPMSKAGPSRPRQPSRTGKHDPPVHHLAQQPRLQRTAPPHRHLAIFYTKVCNRLLRPSPPTASGHPHPNYAGPCQ
jgi:hypothetical protein